MSVMRIFAIYDSKAEAYLQPFFSPTKATAIRSFTQAANDEKTDFYRFAEDYTLFEIGEWDPVGGEIDGLTVKVPLGSAHELKAPEFNERVMSGETPGEVSFAIRERGGFAPVRSE